MRESIYKACDKPRIFYRDNLVCAEFMTKRNQETSVNDTTRDIPDNEVQNKTNKHTTFSSMGAISAEKELNPLLDEGELSLLTELIII